MLSHMGRGASRWTRSREPGPPDKDDESPASAARDARSDVKARRAAARGRHQSSSLSASLRTRRRLENYFDRLPRSRDPRVAYRIPIFAFNYAFIRLVRVSEFSPF